MKILVNDIPVTIPTTLSEFTLGKRIEFYNEYGRELDDMAKVIIEMEDGIDKELEISQYQFEKMIRTFAFFSNCTPEAIRNSKFLDEIAAIYYTSIELLFEEEKNLELSHVFVWNKEFWELHPPELKHGDKMTFGELIDSKQIVKDMMEVGKGKWEYMLPICAIYLRKKDEPYDESFMYEGSERLELMKSLPMNIAMQVGFFLSASMNLYLNSFLSFSQVKPKALEDLANIILTDGVGLTS